MAVDDKLNRRFSDAIGKKIVLVEKRMMGGLCFMLDGNMVGGADRDAKTGYGRFMLRVGKENEKTALGFQHTSVVEQGGRRMGGMIFVDADKCSDQDLQALAELARTFVSSLPAKK